MQPNRQSFPKYLWRWGSVTLGSLYMRRIGTMRPRWRTVQCASNGTGLGMRLSQRPRNNLTICALSRSPSISTVIGECLLSSQSLQLVAAEFIRVTVWGGGHQQGYYNYCVRFWPISIERPSFASKKTTTCPRFWVVRITMTAIAVESMLWQLVRISRWVRRM